MKKLIDKKGLEMDNTYYIILATHLVGREIGERLLKQNPSIKYSDALSQIEAELSQEFHGYEWRMEEYFNKRKDDFLEKISKVEF